MGKVGGGRRAVAVEGLGPVNALRRSWQLVRGHWWHTLGVLFVSTVIYGVAGIAIAFLWGFASDLVRNAVPAIFAIAYTRAVISSIPTLLITPFGVATLAVLYYELSSNSMSSPVRPYGAASITSG